MKLRPGIVNKVHVGVIDTTYHAKTKNHVKIKMRKYIKIFTLTEIIVKGVEDSTIKEYLLLHFV